MFSKKEFRANLFGPNFAYLEEWDKYLFPKLQPKYKFAIIGCGMIGMEHMRVTLLEGRATIHGIYDKSKKSLNAANAVFKELTNNESLTIYSSLEEACNDPELDGLIISTPNFTHAEVLETASQSGKHILLEKPMATTIEDAYKIYKIAEKHDAVFQIGLQYRYKAIYKEAYEEVIRRKAIGDVKTITIMEHRLPFLDKVDQWNKFSCYSGGTLVEKCCHYFDLFNYFAEAKPVSVWASGSISVNYHDFEYKGAKSDILDNAFVHVKYENGISAQFNLCMFAPMFYEEIVLCGDEGRVKAYEMEDFLPGKRLKTGLEVRTSGETPPKDSQPHYPDMIETSGHNGSTFFEHYNLIENMEGKKTETATVKEGFWSIVVGEAAELSIKRGGAVNIAELLTEKGINEKDL
ncbi:MAG: Gfo/Idh/MocA family protein [Spirochaetia bacterium]